MFHSCFSGYINNQSFELYIKNTHDDLKGQNKFSTMNRMKYQLTINKTNKNRKRVNED